MTHFIHGCPFGANLNPQELAQALIEIERNLEKLAIQLAETLESPRSDDSNANLDDLWEQMIQLQPNHSEILHALGPWHAAVDHRAPDYVAQVARRDLIRAATRRSHLWGDVAGLIRYQKTAFYAPLIKAEPNLIAHPSDSLLTDLMHGLHGLANLNHRKKDADRNAEFPDIPLPGDTFFHLMQASYRIAQAMELPRPRRFIDVGCGGGSRCFAAASFFEQIDGLEYDPTYFEAAQETFRRINPHRCTAIEGDALQFTQYGDYQIIYFFRPMSDDKLGAEMETHILSQAAPGTIIVAPQSRSLLWANAKQAPAICKDIHVAHVTQEQATEIREKAEYIGPDWVVDLHALDNFAGFWRPVLDVSHKNGFCSG